MLQNADLTVWYFPWIYYSIPDPDCLADQPGLSDSIPEYVSNLYASFVATNSVPLQAEGGSACYPFADILQGALPSNPYAETSLPQCQMPNSTDGYCAFVFEDANANFSSFSQCEGRRYAMQTFETEDAVPSTASITHKGPCGVCSSAQDWSRRIALRDRMANIGIVCGTDYFLGGTFEGLINCYQEEGYTAECSTLWAHFTATNGMLCASVCITTKPPFNGDPPQCPLNECLTCGEPFQATFDLISGRTSKNSGFTEPIARNCSEFYPVVHDPCPGQTGPTPTPAPTTTTGSDAAPLLATSAAFTMLWFLMGWVDIS